MEGYSIKHLASAPVFEAVEVMKNKKRPKNYRRPEKTKET